MCVENEKVTTAEGCDYGTSQFDMPLPKQESAFASTMKTRSRFLEPAHYQSTHYNLESV